MANSSTSNEKKILIGAWLSAKKANCVNLNMNAIIILMLLYNNVLTMNYYYFGVRLVLKTKKNALCINVFHS